MDPNGNIHQHLDGSLNLSGMGSLGVPGNFPGAMSNMAGLQGYTPEQLIQLQQVNQQKIQQLQAQLAQMQFSEAVPTVGQYTAISPTVPALASTGPLYSQNIPLMNPNFIPPVPVGSTISATSPVGSGFPINLTASLNGPVPNMQTGNFVTTSYNAMTYPNTVGGINSSISNQAYVQVPNNTDRFSGQPRAPAVPNTLRLQNVNAPQSTAVTIGNYSSSGTSSHQGLPTTSSKSQQNNSYPDGPTFMQRPRQMVTSPPSYRPPPSSDRSSTSSSIPGSPSSSGNPPFSPEGSLSDSFGHISPDGTPKKGSNGEIKSPGSQIKNKPLQMETRYPQDKCYHCMKKVYPMEKLGPVRDVVYHKTCFKCTMCNTTLNMKNFFHNQSDSYDKAVYCKSHQPHVTDKGPKLDAGSFEIKSALSAPKQGTIVPESERVPVHAYSYDVTCQEIEHARKAPVADLQSGVKARKNAWSKSKRENFNSPTTAVVKYDEQVPEYNVDEYNRHIIESQPDY